MSRAPLVLLLGLASVALGAPWLAPQDPADLAALHLEDARAAPLTVGVSSGFVYVLGADAQGRDMLSAILHGLRLSLVVATAAVVLATLVGVTAGLAAGWRGGWLDAAIMRLADLQLAMPSILVAMLVFGVIRVALPPGLREGAALPAVVAAIALAEWPMFARAARSLSRIERRKPYIDAARAIGVGRLRLVRVHLFPNVARPLLVNATAAFALAITTEATLSYLGIGLPPTAPSLGTLIRNGQQYIFSGEWWLLAFPAAALVLLTVCVHGAADMLGEAEDPFQGAGGGAMHDPAPRSAGESATANRETSA